MRTGRNSLAWRLLDLTKTVIEGFQTVIKGMCIDGLLMDLITQAFADSALALFGSLIF
jgi:hypothetical protein